MIDNLLLRAALHEIEREMSRLYWNLFQDEIDSPFRNTGTNYKNDTFEVRAYYWGDDEELIHKPNFKWRDFEIHWYKHMGNLGKISQKFSPDMINEMLEDCVSSLYRDYGERKNGTI